MEIFPKKYPLDKLINEDGQYFGAYHYTVTSLAWDRIFLRFTVQTDFPNEPEFVLRSITTRAIVPLKEKICGVRKTEDGKREYDFCLNITAANGRNFLDNGVWHIAYRLGPETILPDYLEGAPEYYDYQQCFVDDEVAYSFPSLTRVFRYGSAKRFAYTIDFEAKSRDGVNISFQINSYFMEKYFKWKRRKFVHERNSLKGKLGKVKYAFAVKAMNLYYRILSLFRKRDGKHILIMAETYETLNGNLKAIDDRLKERGLDRELKITYSFRRSVGNEQSIRSWVKVISKIALQDIIIVDNYVPVFSFLKLKPDVELIQVWHAGGGFKAVGYCRFGKSGSPFPVGSCHKAYTKALCGSPSLVPVFEEVFGIEGKDIMPIGMPRLDGYLKSDRIEAFKRNFFDNWPQLKGKKIILFAPTYRGIGQKTAHYDSERIDLKRIYDVCGDEWAFLIKLHPFILERFDIPAELTDRIIDFSEFPSINDLFYVTELLITDYSSNFYEFSLMRKPMIFYTYDRKVYELCRGVYRSIKESAPGKVCDTFDELVEAIRTKDFEYEKVNTFVEENFGEMADGACDRLIDSIILNTSQTKS